MPAAAQARHTAVPVVALDNRNRITTGAGGGVHAWLEEAGRRLRLFADPEVNVVVRLPPTPDPAGSSRSS